MSPFGLLRYSHEYLHGARIIHQTQPTYSLKYSLAGQSIELGLKAFIRSRGVPAEHFGNPKKGLGHDLSKLLELANRRRMDRLVRLWIDEESVINTLNISYQCHRFRYIHNERTMVPKWEEIEVVAEHLVSGLFEHCIRATCGAPVGKEISLARSGKF